MNGNYSDSITFTHLGQNIYKQSQGLCGYFDLFLLFPFFDDNGSIVSRANIGR